MYHKIADTKIDLLDHNFQSKIDDHYKRGYLLGRIEPGYMYQARSLRVNLTNFLPSSENRRVLKKFPEQYNLHLKNIPISKEDYDWKIHKMASNYYSTKFSDARFSANKARLLLTTNFCFNKIFIYRESETVIGYCIAYLGADFLHYCYPFYDLTIKTNNLGMYMMLEAILWSQMCGLKYIYLGGFTRPADKYKLQSAALEWFTGDKWSSDVEKLKSIDLA